MRGIESTTLEWKPYRNWSPTTKRLVRQTTLEQGATFHRESQEREGGTREGENNFLDASQMPLKIPSELPYQGHGRRANSGKPEVPAQRSDTEELLWKLYDLSCCCQSTKKGSLQNGERRGRNEGK